MLTFGSKLNKSIVSLDFMRNKKFCISCELRKCRPHDERYVTTCLGPGPQARYFLNCLKRNNFKNQINYTEIT